MISNHICDTNDDFYSKEENYSPVEFQFEFLNSNSQEYRIKFVVRIT